MSAGASNLRHVLDQPDCTDPDCELHVPTVIEDRYRRFTAFAWFIAGAQLTFGASPTTQHHVMRMTRAIAHDLLEERPL